MDPLNKKASFYHLKRCFYFKLNHLNKNSMEVKKISKRKSGKKQIAKCPDGVNRCSFHCICKL